MASLAVVFVPVLRNRGRHQIAMAMPTRAQLDGCGRWEGTFDVLLYSVILCFVISRREKKTVAQHAQAVLRVVHGRVVSVTLAITSFIKAFFEGRCGSTARLSSCDGL